MAEDVDGVLVVTHVGAVQGFYHFPVDAPGDNAQVAPDFLSFLRCAADGSQLAPLLSELGDE